MPPAFDESSVDKFTINPISINVLINGIPDDQVSSMYYEIMNQTTGQSVSNTTNKPIKSTTSSNEASFQNVQLSGLNKIIVKYGTNGYCFITRLCLLHASINISNLQFNGVDFVDGGMYPKQGLIQGLPLQEEWLTQLSWKHSIKPTPFSQRLLKWRFHVRYQYWKNDGSYL